MLQAAAGAAPLTLAESALAMLRDVFLYVAALAGV